MSNNAREVASNRPSDTAMDQTQLSGVAISHRVPSSLRNSAGISKALWIGLGLSLGLHVGLLLLPIDHEPVSPPTAPLTQIRIMQLTRRSSRLVKPVATPAKVMKPAIRPVVRHQTPLISLPKASAQSAPPSTPAASSSDRQDDFPIYPDAQPGCFGQASCFQTDASLGAVANYYTKALPRAKYDFKLITDTSDQKVFQVSQHSQSQFLSILRLKNSSVFVVSNQPRSLTEIMNAIALPPELLSVLGDLAARNASPADFTQPSLFYTYSTAKYVSTTALIPKPKIQNISLIPGHTADTLMDDVLRSNLQNNDFEITDLPQPFGNGKVYQIKKGDVTFYLNLVPTKDNAGTLVVAWKERPQ